MACTVIESGLKRLNESLSEKPEHSDLNERQGYNPSLLALNDNPYFLHQRSTTPQPLQSTQRYPVGSLVLSFSGRIGSSEYVLPTAKWIIGTVCGRIN
jgi:hypothetical protein